MAKGLICVTVCCFAMSAVAAPPQPFVVSVCGAVKLKDTHVAVHRGEHWTFEVIGSSPACDDGGHRDSRLQECSQPDCAEWSDGLRQAPVTPRGWEKWYFKPVWFLKRVHSARWYELVGAVGNPFGQTFAIGKGRPVVIETDGELYLFANDAPCRYKNNYGSLRVRIARSD